MPLFTEALFKYDFFLLPGSPDTQSYATRLRSMASLVVGDDGNFLQETFYRI